MADELPYPFLQDPEEMARFEGWTREQLSDLLAVRAGSMSSRDFDTKYRVERAILVLENEPEIGRDAFASEAVTLLGCRAFVALRDRVLRTDYRNGSRGPGRTA